MRTNKTTRFWYRKAAELQAQIDNLAPAIELPPLISWDGTSLWDDMEMFGLEIDDPRLERLTGFYRDEITGCTHSDYRISDDDLVELSFITLDNPPREEAAWDAIPVDGHGRSLPPVL